MRKAPANANVKSIRYCHNFMQVIAFATNGTLVMMQNL